MKMRFFYRANKGSSFFDDYFNDKHDLDEKRRIVELFLKEHSVSPELGAILNQSLLIDSRKFDELPAYFRKQLIRYARLSNVNLAHTIKQGTELMEKWKQHLLSLNYHDKKRVFNPLDYFCYVNNQAKVDLYYDDKQGCLYVSLEYDFDLYELSQNTAVLRVKPLCFGLEEIDETYFLRNVS